MDLKRSIEIYQHHAIACMGDVDMAFVPEGVMEMVITLKAKGIARKAIITAHSGEFATSCLELYDLFTVLFLFNWFMSLDHQMGYCYNNI